MNINFQTTAKFDQLFLDSATNDNEREIDSHNFRQASEIAQTVHHFLRLLKCEHCVPHIGISFRVRDLKPLKCYILFRIHIIWAIFEDVQAEILLEWDEGKKTLSFKEFRRNKRIKDKPIEKPPMAEVKIKNQGNLESEIAKKIIEAISVTLRQICDKTKDRIANIKSTSDYLSSKIRQWA